MLNSLFMFSNNLKHSKNFGKVHPPFHKVCGKSGRSGSLPLVMSPRAQYLSQVCDTTTRCLLRPLKPPHLSFQAHGRSNKPSLLASCCKQRANMPFFWRSAVFGMKNKSLKITLSPSKCQLPLPTSIYTQAVC